MPPRSIDTRSRGRAAASKRLRKTAAITYVGATGVFTVTAGYLNDLAPGDLVTSSAITGGSAISTTTDYYLLPTSPRWSLGATTFRVSALPGGPALSGGTDATAGTVATGDLTAAETGLLSGNYVSQLSPAGR